jgi:hypothetical protein
MAADGNSWRRGSIGARTLENRILRFWDFGILGSSLTASVLEGKAPAEVQ